MRKFTIFILALIIFLIVHCTFYIEHCSAQWYQISLPVSGQVHRMQFINQNTGWLRMTNGNFLKSTNGGVNWQFLSDTSNHVYIFQFFNDTLGYATGMSGLTPLFVKTTNGGLNWFTIYYPNPYGFAGMYFINKDTGWVDASPFPYTTEYIFRTTNGCQTFENIYNRPQSASNPDSWLKFFRNPSDNQYYGYHWIGSNLYKTTNSGYNWTQINTGFSGNINGFSIINKDTAWVVIGVATYNNRILKTTNSGNSWVSQFHDTSHYYEASSVYAVNNNLVYSGFSNFNYHIYLSTNGGNSWGNQISEIVCNPSLYLYDSTLGFAWYENQLVRTTNGGGPITQISNINEQITNNFKLYQNYPNPFNSETEIEFSVPKNAIVNLIVYDILGREIIKLINSREFSSGSYRYNLNLNNYNLSSGVYIYKMNAIEKQESKLFSLVKKMVYSK